MQIEASWLLFSSGAVALLCGSIERAQPHDGFTGETLVLNYARKKYANENIMAYIRSDTNV